MRATTYEVALAAALAAASACASPGPARPAAADRGAAPSARHESIAKAAVRAFVAARLHVPPEELTGGADSPKTALDDPHTRGRLLPFMMWHKDDSNHALRGWVTPDGVVITPTQNLGLLLAEEGVWDGRPRKRVDDLADQIAADLVWTYGAGTDLVTLTDWGLDAPRLRLAPDGAGLFRFFTNDHNGADPAFGIGAAPDRYWEHRVVLTADHQATMTRTEFETTSE